MKLGAMDYLVKGESDRAAFERAREMGFAGIEFNVAEKDLANASCPRPRELAKLRQEFGIAVPSLCLGEHNGNGLIAARNRTADALAEIRSAVRWCGEIGAAVLLVPFFGWNEPRNILQRTWLAEQFRPICREAQTLGVTLCYEGTLAAGDLHAMAAIVDSPAFGVYFDLANVVWVGLDGPTEIRALGRLIKQVHLKEAKFGTGDAHPGDGRVDYAASKRALDWIGYNGWLVMETPGGDAAATRNDMAFARRHFTLD